MSIIFQNFFLNYFDAVDFTLTNNYIYMYIKLGPQTSFLNQLFQIEKEIYRGHEFWNIIQLSDFHKLK